MAITWRENRHPGGRHALALREGERREITLEPGRTRAGTLQFANGSNELREEVCIDHYRRRGVDHAGPFCQCIIIEEILIKRTLMSTS